MGSVCSRRSSSTDSPPEQEEDEEHSWSFGFLLRIDSPTPTRGSGSHLSSSNQDASIAPQAQLQSIRYNKINPAAVQVQSSAHVTISGITAQRTELELNRNEPQKTRCDEINLTAVHTTRESGAQGTDVAHNRSDEINSAGAQGRNLTLAPGKNAAQGTEPLHTRSDETDSAAAQGQSSASVTSVGNKALRTEPVHNRSAQINSAAGQDQNFTPATGGNAAQSTGPLHTRSDETNLAALRGQSFASVTSIGNTDLRSKPLIISCDKNITSATCMAKDQVPHDEPKRKDTVPIIIDEGQFCPICFDEYDKENPKLLTPCKHDYHFACLLQWMEKSCTCPMCDRVVTLDSCF